jgi:hypothetical protein
MAKMSRLQKAKRSFRASKKWKLFRHKKNVDQKGLDPITGSKLTKGCNLHHRHITADDEEYGDISNENDYVMLNSLTHKFLHWGYRYFLRDPDFLRKIKAEWEKWY